VVILCQKGKSNNCEHLLNKSGKITSMKMEGIIQYASYFDEQLNEATKSITFALQLDVPLQGFIFGA
jgi:hypothetical protein